MVYKTFLTIILVVQASTITKADDCAARTFPLAESVVCVCNATYCDTVPQAPKVPKEGTYQWYLSNKAGNRLKLSVGSFSASALHETTITVNRSETYQSIIGWGGAFTDAAGINIRNLSELTQDQLLRTYFGPNGSRYNLGRVPIGGNDFSTRAYTLDDTQNDFKLDDFSLAEEDYQYKIPIIHKAKELYPDLKIFATPWTAPPWMKTNNKSSGFGFLREDCYQTYANYILKFLRSYKEHDIDIWAVSTGNEPSVILLPTFKLDTMGWTPQGLGKWVAENLGPSLANSKFNMTQILAIDDQRFMLPWFLDEAYHYYPEARNYIAGTAIHWYFDSLIPPTCLDLEQQHRPEKFILMTEACTGTGPFSSPNVKLGSWDRAESLILDMIQNLRHWVTGWIDWNLALDRSGGPTYINNRVDASIIVNPEADEFYKQPLYYAMTHFSAFVPAGSLRIASTDSRTISTVAFKTPSNSIVVLLYNKQFVPQHIVINDTQSGTVNLELPAYSMSTVIYI